MSLGSDESIAVIAVAIQVTTIARQRLINADVLRMAVDDPADCGLVDGVIALLAKSSDPERAHGLMAQVSKIQAFGGWSRTLERSSSHAQHAWAAAVWVARGEQ